MKFQQDRRQFLKVTALAGAAALADPRPWLSTRSIWLVDPRRLLQLGSGPHLFVDDYLIERSDGIARVAISPARLPSSILDSARFGVFTPYLTVTNDRHWQRKRLWYNRGTSVWHAESDDGIAWRNERVAWDLPRGFGSSLIDEDGRDVDGHRRFKLANWQSTREFDDTPRDDGGVCVGFSRDGLSWSRYSGNPVLRTWPEGHPKLLAHSAGDIVDVFYDPLNRRYACALKLYSLRGEMPVGPKAGTFTRRLVGMTVSDDFINWKRPWRIFVPDRDDEGLTEFYGMAGTHARGSLLIGFLRVLRDDLPHEPGAAAEGIGYTVLTTSRDGVNWTRDRRPFLDRNTETGTWDRAMTWVGCALPMGDEVFIYYGGYARGHKVAPETERQIGFARMQRDRYVAREAGAAEGTFRTPLLHLNGDRMTVNADVKGALRIAVLDAEGAPIRGFDREDSTPIAGDDLAHAIGWQQPLRTLRGRPVQLEFRLRDARVYGFELSEA